MSEQKRNIFVRCLVVALAGFIVWIVSYSFLSLNPKGSISTGIITLILLLVVIVLSESFDNFNVIKLFSMSREIKTKEKSIDKLNSENTELRRELVNIVTSFSQHQSSTNIIGLPTEIAKLIGVEKASEAEITKKRSEETESSSETTRPVRRSINIEKLEEIAMAKFLSDRNLSDYDLIKEAKLVTQFSGIDAVSNIQPIFDGYINTGESEIFIEIKASRGYILMLREKIYLMLNKIYLYNKLKNANAHMNLILVQIENDDSTPSRAQRNIDRLKEFFEPAIVKGLLKLVPVELTEEESRQIYIED